MVLLQSRRLGAASASGRSTGAVAAAAAAARAHTASKARGALRENMFKWDAKLMRDYARLGAVGLVYGYSIGVEGPDVPPHFRFSEEEVREIKRKFEEQP